MEARLVPVQPCALVLVSDVENGTACDFVQSWRRDFHLHRIVLATTFFVGRSAGYESLMALPDKPCPGRAATTRKAFGYTARFAVSASLLTSPTLRRSPQHDVNGYARARGVWQ
jgi:hypothetical protein